MCHGIRKSDSALIASTIAMAIMFFSDNNGLSRYRAANTPSEKYMAFRQKLDAESILGENTGIRWYTSIQPVAIIIPLIPPCCHNGYSAKRQNNIITNHNSFNGPSDGLMSASHRYVSESETFRVTAPGATYLITIVTNVKNR